MKNIKISGLFNFDNANPNFIYEDGSPISIKNVSDRKNEISKEIGVLWEIKPNKKVLFKSRTISHNNLTFIAPFPNPIHLLLNTCIENFNASMNVLNQFESGENLVNENIVILVLNDVNTSNKYNDFVRYRIVSIITLVNALEAFLNQIIPNDFKYESIEKGIIRVYDKKKIESSKISFREKLTSVIDQFKKDTNFVNNNSDLIDKILETYQIRKEIVHLKTNSETELGLYWETIGKILEFDIALAIENTIKYINNVEKDFVLIDI